MQRLLVGVAAVSLVSVVGSPLAAQQEERYDYWRTQRNMVRYGQQAIFMCNGLFTSHRTLEQIFDHELKFLPQPVGTAEGGDYEVDRERRAVTIGAAGGTPQMRAVFREGIGCVILPPDQTLDDATIAALPELTLPAPPGDPATIAWPDGDRRDPDAAPPGVSAAALQAASDWAFNRPTPEQDTLSLIVVKDGQIVHERYADGVETSTRTRTWSTAKSIASTLIGMLVDEGKLKLDEPLGFDSLPEAAAPGRDPRSAITLRHVLTLSSGL